MRLKLIDAPALDLVASWVARKENYQWLDFGAGVQLLSPVNLKIITQRDSHLLRVFTPDTDDMPIGLVALSNIARNFQTASLWYVLGDKRYRGQGYTTRAVSEMLTLGFEELALESVNAWTVESNEPSIKVLTRNHFQLVGRQRRCHWLDGRPFDRLLFDVLRTDHKPV